MLFREYYSMMKEPSEDDLIESPQELLQDSQGNVIENPKKFLKWFNGSKIVDASGKPLVCYHGTKQAFDKVDVKKGSQGIFWLSSSKDKITRGDSGAVSSKVVLEFYVRIKNPAGWKEYDQYSIGELIGLGYDGVILKDIQGFDIIIFENNQVIPVRK